MSLFLLLWRKATGPLPPPDLDAGADVADLEAACLAALGADSVLTGLLGSNLFPSRIPEPAAIPALTYELLTYSEGFTLLRPDGLATARIRFTALAFSKADVGAITAAVRRVLLPVRGSFHGVWVAFVRTAALGHDYDDSQGGSDDGTHRRSIDLKFRFRATIPT